MYRWWLRRRSLRTGVARRGRRREAVTRTNAVDRDRRRDRAASVLTIYMEEGACQMSRKRENADASGGMDIAAEGVPVPPTPGNWEDEIGSLARELARGQRELIDQFQRYAGMEAVEAA